MGAACQCISKKKSDEQPRNDNNKEQSISKLTAPQDPTKQNNPYESNLVGADPSISNPQSRVDLNLPKQEDRSRKSTINASKMKPVSQLEWAYEKNGSKITVKKQSVLKGEKSRISQAIPEQQLKNKLVKSFTIQAGTGHKQLIRNSNYLDDSYGKIDDIDPTADRSLANFQIDDSRTIGVP